ncbi:dynamin family protein [Paenibacillus sp. S150]|uniref:dynamin family protein n=1 Tax=Paenibacillus sp. S150 TaxID=2749826 RepID=UPI001C58ADFE|nr:dynamin family protein [Paenibacillus sp. S150]MBW4085613.1 dynamin family protein [Paenibacillus sp. S150]
MGAEQAKKEKEILSELPYPGLRKLMQQWGDTAAEQIIMELEAKAAAGELTFAFCGHFSAGKSSMVNLLCGRPVLPSGPVPTSANIVSIRSGAPRVLLYPQTNESGVRPAPWETTPEQLQEFCRRGGDYSAIDVWENVPLLGRHGVLMDTPGVDSTDNGHQAATHSALHLADVVFYVMDYNHVQSENNLAFAKALSEWGKPLYLIVNQIDKHREREISIEVYRQQLESAFGQWGIHPAGILFTSLKVLEHPLNQWRELPGLIGRLLEQREELLQYSLSRSLYHTADAALAAYREEQREEREQLLEEAGTADRDAVEQALLECAGEREKALGLAEEARTDLRASLDALLGNSSLMPAEVREAAGAYAESASPGFRKGLLFTPAKREKERQKRLAAWHALQTREIAAQLEWHLLQLVRQWGEGLGLWDEAAETALKQAFPAVSPSFLEAAVKPGTGFSGEALLNFCRTLAAEIKAGFRRAALGAGDELLAKLPPLVDERCAELARREAALQRQARALAALAALDRAADARAADLAALLLPRRPLTPGTLPEVRVTPRAGAQHAAPRTAQPPQRAAAGSPAAGLAAGTASPAGGRRRLGQAAAALDAAAELLRREPAMASAARSLAARAADLAGGRFTLALFGAFSAGKSSFANALLGEEVLPVSPHPATAAVNRILAPEGDFRHASAVVTMKSMEDFWEDILHSFGVLQLAAPQRETWTAAAANLQVGGLHPSSLPHAGFLRAAAAGWREAEPLLGTVRTVDLQEYRLLVAEETRACFIQGIDLYYECPLTAGGIVLVDTPGADSLHARHTGVTFGYMKNADAICFVTYYNHAFSKADRGLLAQLGRIKDSFALDKMFFIINASDLAADEEELQEVQEHVVQNLRAGGLTAPQLYSLSSLLALEGKTSNNPELYGASRFSRFEQALADFAGGELPRLSLAAARDSLVAVRRRTEEWQVKARQAAGRREAEMERLQEQRRLAEQRLELLAAEERPRRDLRREGEELLYHVRQRISFSFGRFFQESFHPSLLREDGGHLKEIFTACGRELERTIQRELEQELWATTLRLEAAGRRLVRTAALSAAAELSIPADELQFLQKDNGPWASPAKLECRLAPLDWMTLWNHFKSPRHFFEGTGRNEVRAAAEPRMKEAVAGASSALEGFLLDFYADGVQAALSSAVKALRENLAEREAAITELLKGGDSAEHWSRLSRELLGLEQAFGDIVDNIL